MGERGLIWYDETAADRGSCRRSPCRRIASIDTNGAGDIFHGAYVYSLSDATRIAAGSEHFRFARAASAHAIQHLGNEASLPTLGRHHAHARRASMSGATASPLGCERERGRERYSRFTGSFIATSLRRCCACLGPSREIVARDRHAAPAAPAPPASGRDRSRATAAPASAPAGRAAPRSPCAFSMNSRFGSATGANVPLSVRVDQHRRGLAVVARTARAVAGVLVRHELAGRAAAGSDRTSPRTARRHCSGSMSSSTAMIHLPAKRCSDGRAVQRAPHFGFRRAARELDRDHRIEAGERLVHRDALDAADRQHRLADDAGTPAPSPRGG